MLKRRIIRESDYDGLIDQIRLDQAKIDALHETIGAMQERLIEAEASKRSAMTMRDVLVTRVNQLEEESATLRHKLTGLPQIAPKIERGSPLRSSEIGAGVDLFEDVGDDKARQLHDQGLLHEEAPIEPLAGAAELTKHLQ